MSCQGRRGEPVERAGIRYVPALVPLRIETSDDSGSVARWEVVVNDEVMSEAQIGAASYLLPPTQGLTGGASPQAPAGATPESSSTDGTTPPTTSATITGVR